ncbi:MAG: hypothetical protein K9M13_01020 [Simkaniaceae bacterium]|nr:hypothetical protein [Simkaniaceae bacterium]
MTKLGVFNSNLLWATTVGAYQEASHLSKRSRFEHIQLKQAHYMRFVGFILRIPIIGQIAALIIRNAFKPEVFYGTSAPHQIKAQFGSFSPSETTKVKSIGSAYFIEKKNQYVRNADVLPEEFKTTIPCISGEIQSTIDAKKTTTKTFVIDGHDSVYIPTTTSIQLIAAHYKTKYGIEIFICDNTDNLPRLLTEKSQEAKTFGIIMATDPHLHVTPILCRKSSAIEEPIEIALMDSVANNAGLIDDSHGLQFIRKLTETELDYRLMSSFGARQVDEFSCRVDALTLLKRALIDLKGREGTKLSDYLKINNEKESKELGWQQFASNELTPKSLASPDRSQYVPYQFFKVPETWAVGRQYADGVGFRDDAHSTVVHKKETLDAFQRRYYKTIDVVTHFQFSSSPSYGTTEKPPQYDIQVVTQKEFNTYWAQKSHKYVDLVSKIIAEKE